MAAEDFTSNPASESYRRIDFESAQVNGGFVNDTYLLTVTGSKPCINMQVSLSPLVYFRCPEYWGIEVIGHLPNGICLDAIGRFEETIELRGIRGSEGIEVVGATKREKFTVSGGCNRSTTFGKRSS